MKAYDKSYYDRWYRDPKTRVSTLPARERKVRLAVAVAEYLLERPVRTVLDIGCGEGAWLPVLKRLRPDIKYTGIDPSEYVVQRFGKTRNIKLGSFANFDQLRLPRSFDLVVCADALQYVTASDAARGLLAIRRKLSGPRGGIAYIEAYTTDDDMTGDLGEWQDRTTAQYKRLFRNAGLTQCAPQCYTDLERLPQPLSFDTFAS